MYIILRILLLAFIGFISYKIVSAGGILAILWCIGIALFAVHAIVTRINNKDATKL
jgi:hypothetical protein